MERDIQWREYGETVIHPVALAFTLLMALWLLRARRDQAVLPFILVACLIPVAQRVVIGTLDFNMARIMLLFGWARLVMSRELTSLTWCRLDTAFCVWLAAGTVSYVVREASISALIYRLGVMFDGLGVYFLLRYLLRNASDVLRSLAQLATIACVVAFFMVIENLTGRNYFSIFGGVPEYTQVRDGRLRCQGAFSHPIMAGSFGASLFPALASLVAAQVHKHKLIIAGTLASLVIVLTSASSGPALALVAAMIGLGLYLARGQLAWIRWGAVALVIVIHFVRDPPVWHLIGRASDLIGGTGYHRVQLISAFFDHWKEWILVGTGSTAHWGWGLQDVTNEFVLQGVRGGLMTLVSFLVVLLISFGYVGRTRQRIRRGRWLPASRRHALELLSWGLGTALLAHCVGWIGVSYFGQMELILYVLFALIAALHQTPELRRPRARSPQSDQRTRSSARATPHHATARSAAQ